MENKWYVKLIAVIIQFFVKSSYKIIDCVTGQKPIKPYIFHVEINSNYKIPMNKKYEDIDFDHDYLGIGGDLLE